MQNLEDPFVRHSAPEYAADGVEAQLYQQTDQGNPHNRRQDTENQQNLPLGLVLTVHHIPVLVRQGAQQPAVRHRNPGQPRIFQPPPPGNGVQSQCGQYIGRNGQQHGHPEQGAQNQPQAAFQIIHRMGNHHNNTFLFL